MEDYGCQNDQPRNELSNSSVPVSSNHNVEETSYDLLKQQGSHCVLYSILNCIQDKALIRKFLKLEANDDTNDLTHYEDWMVTNRIEHAKEYNNKHEPFHNGVTSMDIEAYMRHLKEEGILLSYTFKDHTRFTKLEYFSTSNKNKRYQNYVLMGYTTTSEKRSTVQRRFIDEDKALKKLKRYDWQRHRDFSRKILRHFSPVVEATTFEESGGESEIRLRTSSEMSAERRKAYQVLGTVNLHAMAIKFDHQGIPHILETGRMKAHKLTNDPITNTALKEIVFSFPALYKLYYIKLKFSNK
jgi:hypothetical protein